MEARTLKSREYNTDIFNTRSSATNGTTGLYDPHPYLRDQVNSDNRTRTSFQDSNIFGYKEDKNVTWQGTGRDDRPAGIRTETYNLAFHSPDNVLYNPEASMGVHKTHTQKTYVEPEKEMYYYNDPRIPKSRLGEEVFGVKTFDRSAAGKELLAGDKHWLRHADFNRDEDVEGVSPEERKQRELVGQISEYQREGPVVKTGELKLETLSSWKDPNKAEKRSNVIKDVNTYERRQQELSSVNNPLTTTDYSDFTPKTKQQQCTENVEQRVRDAMYSDLYGQTGKYGPKAKVAQRSEVSSSTGIFSKEGAQKGSRWGEDLSAAERRQDFLRTTGFPVHYEVVAQEKKVPSLSEINLARSQLRMPKVLKACELEARRFHEPTNAEAYSLVKDGKEADVITLRFKGLPKLADERSLKAMSGAKHIVRVSVKTDNIKNECTGEGEITIRLGGEETKEDIISRYTSAGIIAEDKPETERKRSNYHELATTGWRDSKLEFAEKRHINTGWETDKISKVQNLSTNVYMGTNDTLVNMGQQYADVIRSRMDNLDLAQKTAETHTQLMYDWNNMRPQTASATGSALQGERSFLRPTESFDTRRKQVQDSIRKKYY